MDIFFAWLNRVKNQAYRRMPLADVDPTAKPETTDVQDCLPPIKDSPERMELQVKATGRALAALEDAYPYLNTIDKYMGKTFMYFYKRMPLWYMLATGRLAMSRAEAEVKAGQKEEAKKILEDALVQFEKKPHLCRGDSYLIDKIS